MINNTSIDWATATGRAIVAMQGLAIAMTKLCNSKYYRYKNKKFIKLNDYIKTKKGARQ